MGNKFKPVYGGPLPQNMVQQHACAQALENHLETLAALYPDCDVHLSEHDEIFLVEKNGNPNLPDLKAIGESIHEAAEGRINAIGAQEQRELQRWQNWAGGWGEGVQGLLDFAQQVREAPAVYDFYVCPPLRPRLLKTKKGPRRYRVQMVRCYYKEDFCAKVLGGIPGRIHQTTKLLELP